MSEALDQVLAKDAWRPYSLQLETTTNGLYREYYKDPFRHS